MSQFAPLIMEISERLCVPQPARSRILLEIAADLEDLYGHYLARGMAPEEAAARTRATLELSEEALASLIRIHEPPLRRLLERLSEQARSLWERVTLLVVTIFVVVLTVSELLTTHTLATGGLFVWPLAAIAVTATLIALVKIYTLYLKQDHDLYRLRRGLDLLLFLATASLAVGLFGLIAEVLVTARHIVSDIDWAQLHLTDCLIRISVTSMFSMVVAIAIGVAWFVLLSKVQRIERAEAEVLLTSIRDGGQEPGMPDATSGLQSSWSQLSYYQYVKGGIR
jgi:hypothetical protein